MQKRLVELRGVLYVREVAYPRQEKQARAGNLGGKVVAKGSPEEVAKVRSSYTGQFLRKVLGRGERKDSHPACTESSCWSS